MKEAKQTDAIVQEELEAVRVRAISPPSIVNFDKLGKVSSGEERGDA